MLWLALHCSDLALEVFAGVSPDEPTAVVEGEGSRETVVACNEAARAGGLRAGMTSSAARVRVPGLRMLARDRGAERSALQRLAGACLAWTDHVAPEPPGDVLLEVGGSLHLFGGIERLGRQVDGLLDELGYAAGRGVAPTPEAARLLARAGGGTVLEAQRLPDVLARLPWTVLEPDEATAGQLHGWGLRTLGECFALPRAGVAQRLGEAFLNRLDRLRGARGETVPRFEAPPRFQGVLSLPAETAELDLPLAALERLAAELEAWLRARDAGIQRFAVDLHPPRGPRTSVYVGLAAPGREADHLLAVARERLERVELPGAIVAVGLRSHRCLPYHPPGHDLWAEAGAEPPERLLERLRARLGHDAVQGVTLHADHRPERAWAWQAPGAVPAHEPRHAPPRPLWLLREPAPLALDAHGRPQCRGTLELLDGPERIETGWWDGDDVERDYFIARSPEGMTLWVYRERRVPRTWYVQGLFA